jgi:hypothetical protein
VIEIRLDFKSLAATLFLGGSLYVMTGADPGSVYVAAIAMAFVIAITVCLYFSYRLALVWNKTE